MTPPRRVLPAKTYLVTRRCSERRFFLRPDAELTSVFEYLLGLASERYGVELHGFVCMSNHYHLVVSDILGNLPAFEQYLNSLLARSVNCMRGRWEAFWTRESYNAPELVEASDVLDKLVYTLVNPVRAGLVGRARDWEGATSARMGFGQRRRVARPALFFSERMPEYVTLELRAPAGMGSAEQEAVRARVERIEEEVRETGSKPMGMRAVLRQPWNGSPNTPAPRRQLIPRFAAKRAAVRVAALVEYRRWLDAYYEALASFRRGRRDVEWPAGTYQMFVGLGCPRVV